jgi:hypothetical protein
MMLGSPLSPPGEVSFTSLPSVHRCSSARALCRVHIVAYSPAMPPAHSKHTGRHKRHRKPSTTAVIELKPSCISVVPTHDVELSSPGPSAALPGMQVAHPWHAVCHSAAGPGPVNACVGNLTPYLSHPCPAFSRAPFFKGKGKGW